MPTPTNERHGEHDVVLTHKDTGTTLAGIQFCQSAVDEPPLIEVPVIQQRFYRSFWEDLGWEIEAKQAGARCDECQSKKGLDEYSVPGVTLRVCRGCGLVQSDTAPAAVARVDSAGIVAEIDAERARAHAKHGDKSIEAWPAFDLNRYPILGEEVGEVAKEFCEAAIEERPVDAAKLRAELLQVASVAIGWIAAIDRETT